MPCQPFTLPGGARGFICSRTLAVIFLIGWALAFTHAIGKPTSADPVTWAGAWGAVSIIAVAMWIGWQAGRESKVAA